MIANKVSFPQLQPRTKVAVVIAWFQEKFQQDTADGVWHDFRFTTQESGETVEDWGTRIKRLRNKVQKFGIRITWKQYLRKWTVGTRTSYFTSQLRETLCPADYRREPVVTDLLSFESWFQRFLRRQRDRARDLAEHSRLTTIQKMRKKSNTTPGSPGNPQEQVDTPRAPNRVGRYYDRYRQGPGSRVNQNQYSNLFHNHRPITSVQVKAANLSGNKERQEDRICYNCNMSGHLAKD